MNDNYTDSTLMFVLGFILYIISMILMIIIFVLITKTFYECFEVKNSISILSSIIFCLFCIAFIVISTSYIFIFLNGNCNKECCQSFLRFIKWFEGNEYSVKTKKPIYNFYK